MASTPCTTVAYTNPGGRTSGARGRYRTAGKRVRTGRPAVQSVEDAFRLIYTSLCAEDLQSLLAQPVPDFVWEAAALASFTKGSVELSFDGTQLEFRSAGSDLLRYEVLHLSVLHTPETIARVAVLVMRALPLYEAHPLILLHLGRNYELPVELLPEEYVARFQADRTQLSGSVLFMGHDSARCHFRTSTTGLAFSIGWAELQRAIKERRFVPPYYRSVEHG